MPTVEFIERVRERELFDNPAILRELNHYLSCIIVVFVGIPLWKNITKDDVI